MSGISLAKYSSKLNRLWYSSVIRLVYLERSNAFASSWSGKLFADIDCGVGKSSWWKMLSIIFKREERHVHVDIL